MIRESKPSESPFGILLRQAQQGSISAMGSLYEQYSSHLRGALRRRLRGEMRRWYDTEDLLQSVFGELIRSIGLLEDRGEAAFRRWLSLRAESKFRDKIRKPFGRRRPRREESLPATLPLPDPGPSPST